jgi:catechol 2,3-dioxygenase-like lactoylglutathione lyase family enzyme
MLSHIHPKLPMRNKTATKAYYLNALGFEEISDYGDYLIVAKDQIELHFFEFKTLDPQTNYGQVYIRTIDIEGWYRQLLENSVVIHPNAPLAPKPWGQQEFSLLDPDNNLLTFGEAV